MLHVISVKRVLCYMQSLSRECYVTCNLCQESAMLHAITVKRVLCYMQSLSRECYVTCNLCQESDMLHAKNTHVQEYIALAVQ